MRAPVRAVFRTTGLVAGLAALLLLAIACEEDVMTPGEEVDDPDADVAGIAVIDNAFAPDDINIDEGTTVRFRHEGENTHTVTINGVNQSGDLEPGDEFAFSFDRTGEHSVTCDYHPEMTVSVTVTGPID